MALACAVLSLFGCGKPSGNQSSHSEKWGTINTRPMVLTVPLELEPELRSVSSRNPWFFTGWDEKETRNFIESIIMPMGLKKRLVATIEPCPEIQGSVLMPSVDNLLELPAKARSRIYNVLSRYDINHEQVNARRYPAESMAEWMDGVDLSAQTLQLLEKLSYRNGSLLFFADVSILFNRIEDKQERFAAYKALHRVKTMRASLCAEEGDDLNTLIHYWGTGGREEDVMPILVSLKDDGGCIDLNYLMPSIARRLIYRYPKTEFEMWQQQDCHWTAMNFFNFRPYNGLQVEGRLQDVITKDYAIIQEENLQFGDVIIYLDEYHGEVRLIHSTVYIAGDIVFTKNGTNCASPWMYMTRQHMDDYYNYGSPLKKMYLRRTSSSLERARNQMRGKRIDRPVNG